MLAGISDIHRRLPMYGHPLLGGFSASGDAIDPFLQIPGQNGGHAGHERSQFLQTGPGGDHDDDRNRWIVLVLLMLEVPIHRDESIELVICHEARKSAVADARPTRLLDGMHVA